MQIALTIILENPPVNVSFALQKGAGNNYESVQVQQSKNGEDLLFKFSIDVKGDKPSPADFKGPFVQGAKDSRFVYIGIGKYAGVKGEPWDRRLKIPLAGITWEMLNSKALITKVAGMGKDGTPNCATVKPFNGWQVN